jgi:hypothetical protein
VNDSFSSGGLPPLKQKKMKLISEKGDQATLALLIPSALRD